MNALPKNVEPHDAAYLGPASLVPVTPGRTPNPLWSVVEHAIYYATNNGWPVFPAPPGEKKSYYAAQYSGGRKWGQTTDADEIRRYWQEHPNANIGIVCGEVSGVFVVETDTAAHGDGVDGAASLAALEVQYGPLPATRMAISPSGSVHRYFRYPGSHVINSSNVIAPGVDVRGDGGMVIAPPNWMPAREAKAATPAIPAIDGKPAREAKKAKPARAAGAYRWLNDLPIADAPQWLLDRNVPAKAISQRAVDLVRTPPGAIRGAASGGDNFWRRVNDRALDGRAGWVQALFGNRAQLKSINGMQVWRVTSEDLGRDLEEDLSIAPYGIFDWGTEEPLTAIDVVMRFSSSGKTDEEAALWLCEQMGIAPAELGWETIEWILPDSNSAPDDFNKAGTQSSQSSDEQEEDQEQEHPKDQAGDTNAEGDRPANEVPPSDARPAIQIKAGHLSSLATKGEEVLIAAGVPIYQRGGTLVRPIIETVDASRGRKTKVAQLRVIDPVYLRDLLGRYAIWGKYNERKKEVVRIDPPQEIAATVLARVGEWAFPAISGVISAPTMRTDGSLLLEKGYDEATGLLLVEPPVMPAIPDQPTKKDAEGALQLLEALLTGFPFVDDVAKAVALSAIFTPVVRGAFSVTPLHASRAPTAGSGKSFLWDIVAAIAIGQLMPVMSTGASEEETEKRLGSAVMKGQPLISIDNIKGELGGDALCQIIERPVVDIRILGRSENVRVEARGTSMFATGNNFVVVGDVCRRVITVNLDPAMEQPELRQFKFDPVEMILKDRGKYIAAVLTICRAYIVAGRPGKAPRLASFEGWSDTVRSALIWLGCEDVVKSMETARAEDPERIELDDMLEVWARAFGVGSESRVKLAGAIMKGTAMVKPDLLSPLEPTCPDLYAALEVVAYRATGKRGQKPDAAMLGNWLRRFKGRVINGRRFANKSHEKRGAEWWVEEVKANPATGGAT